MAANRRLVTIPVSHYCEKARWALERAGLDYSEERHIPLVAAVHAKRAGGGITVPVLVAEGTTYGESREILGYADAHAGEERKLYPDGKEERAEVRRFESRFDADLGPATRLVGYDAGGARRDVAAYVAEGVPSWERQSLLTSVPVAVRVMRKRFGINPEAVAKAQRTIDEIFDEVATRLNGSRYLVGERFSAADLTFAALASPMLAPPEFTVPLPPPEKMPGAAERMRELQEHPAGKFALRLFADERRQLS